MTTKEKSLENHKSAKKKFNVKTEILENGSLTGGTFIKYGDIEFSGDTSGWRDVATLSSGHLTYKIENYDLDFVVTIHDDRKDTLITVDLPLHQFADLMRLFQVTEKMRVKIGRNKICSKVKISKIKATKTEEV